MDKIIISDLAVFCRVGVPDEERAKPQRLLISLEMLRDLSTAAVSDDLTKTIDYYALTRRVLGFGEGRSWKLIEALAADIANMVLNEFAAAEDGAEDGRTPENSSRATTICTDLFRVCWRGRSRGVL